MNTARRIVLSLIVVSLAVVVAESARADWSEGDPHKMHYPQLPDPNGWDVNATHKKMVADDWKCSSSGLITGIHIWGF